MLWIWWGEKQTTCEGKKYKMTTCEGKKYKITTCEGKKYKIGKSLLLMAHVQNV